MLLCVLLVGQRLLLNEKVFSFSNIQSYSSYQCIAFGMPDYHWSGTQQLSS